MATSGLIARQNRDGSFDSIVVHFGHPDWIGPLLVHYYTEDAKVNALLSLGSLSHLDREIGEKHSFDQPHPGRCVAFGRDRGQDNTESRRSESLADLVQLARRPFLSHIFVWALNPQTGQKAWATVPMPQETQASVAALIEDIWHREQQGQTNHLGDPANEN